MVAGKWAATALVALVTITVTLGASHLILRHPRIQAVDLPVGHLDADAAQMWLVLAPLAFFAPRSNC